MPKVWLSRQRDGSYMMTRFKPVKARVGITNMEDFYVQPGEPVGVRHLCPMGVKYFLGVEIEIGEQVQVNLDIRAEAISAGG